MPILDTKKLILVHAKEIEFKGQQGEMVKCWKYQFVDPDLEFIIAYGQKGTFKDEVHTLDKGWDESKAKNFVFEVREWDGQKKLKLVEG